MCKSFIVHLYSSSLNFPLLLNPSIDCRKKYHFVGNRNNKLHLGSWRISCWAYQYQQFQSVIGSFTVDTNAGHLPQQQPWLNMKTTIAPLGWECSYSSHGRTWTRWLMWSGSSQVTYGRRWTNRRFSKWLHKQWRENRRHTRGWRRTASCSEQKSSTPVCMRKPLDYHAECILSSVQQI